MDAILERGPHKGIQSIVVYPMNALANGQEQELTKFLCHGYPDGKGPVTFRRYTGQEGDEERQQILADPPDILLTNYVMLELILTRVDERKLIQAAKVLGDVAKHDKRRAGPQAHRTRTEIRLPASPGRVRKVSGPRLFLSSDHP